jgi:hypothetical protein
MRGYYKRKSEEREDWMCAHGDHLTNHTTDHVTDITDGITDRITYSHIGCLDRVHIRQARIKINFLELSLYPHEDPTPYFDNGPENSL